MSTFDLDHVGIAVLDLDRSAETYRRLGFLLTERSYHMASGPNGERIPAGTGNHCFILQRGYVELIAQTATGYSGRLVSDLEKYEGLHLVSFGSESTDDALAVLSRTAKAEIEARRVSRPFQVRGEQFEATFDILDLPEGRVEEAHLFAIRHLTPQAIWQERLIQHENGARELLSVAFCVENPVELAQRVGTLFDATVTEHMVGLRRGALEFFNPDGFRDRFAGESSVSVPSVAAISLRVDSVVETASYLDAHDVSFSRSDQRLVVPHAFACGVLIEFTEMGDRR